MPRPDRKNILIPASRRKCQERRCRSIFSAIKFPVVLFSLPQLTCSATALGQLYDNRYERSTTCGDKSAIKWTVIISRETFYWQICSLQTNTAADSKLESTLIFI